MSTLTSLSDLLNTAYRDEIDGEKLYGDILKKSVVLHSKQRKVVKQVIKKIRDDEIRHQNELGALAVYLQRTQG